MVPNKHFESVDHQYYFVFLLSLMACHSANILIFKLLIPFSTRKKYGINQMLHHFSS